MRYLIGLLLLATAMAQAAPTVTLTASPTSGLSPFSTTLTWSSTESTACTASGAWSGAKATSGSQVVSNLLVSSTFTLTCGPSSGTASVSWTAPTQNMDGTPLTNLAGYKLYWATTTAGVPSATPVVINSPTTLSYNVTGLAAGTWYFGAKASNSAGVDSNMSNLANKTIVLTTASASATVTVSTQPNPPVITVVNQTAWEYFPPRGRNILGKLGKDVGIVPLGTPCGERMLGTYYTVPRSEVDFTRKTNAIVVARCESNG